MNQRNQVNQEDEFAQAFIGVSINPTNTTAASHSGGAAAGVTSHLNVPTVEHVKLVAT